ncbi:MAG TPA: HlyD family efflux transporter periplasmic adaptor subunit, partial [Spirochaetales bacterium]|nr:HlyD family efflux transporter periplasmic adaptor subunit [Spirochaetales bacterium]
MESRSSVVTIAGRLKPARTATHSAPAAGYIAELFVRPGERVRAGQALVSIGRDIPGESYRPLVVSSRIAGVVSTLALKEGEEVRSGAVLATVLDDSSFTLEAAVSDKDA